MKKLLVLALVVVLTLSLTLVASAAKFDPYVGGEFQLVYSDKINTQDAPFSATVGGGDYARYKFYGTGTVSDDATNTWAKVGVLFKTWSGNTANPVFEAGIRKLAGGKLNIMYTNDESGSTQRGQIPLVQSVAKFGGDPGFSNGEDGFVFDYNGDSAVVNFIIDPNKDSSTADATMRVAATIKFDGGNVWVGYGTNATWTPGTNQIGVGMQYGLGIGTLSVDYISKTPKSGTGGNYIQANMNFTDLKLDATLLIDSKYQVGAESATGIGLVYNVSDQLYVGVKSITPKTGDADSNFYLGYKKGVFDCRLGSAKQGGQDITYATAHVGCW